MTQVSATLPSEAPEERAAPPEPETKGVIRFLPVAAVIGVVVLVAGLALLLLSTRQPPMRLRTVASNDSGPTGRHTTTRKLPSKIPHTKPAHKVIKPASVLAKVSRPYLRRTLRFLSGKPHLSGTKYSEENIVDFIVGQFRKHGLDTAEKVPYRILHQYPDLKNPNKVQLVDAEGKVLDEAKFQEDPVPGDHTHTVVPGYLSYARPGTVEADVVYVGSGTHKDLDLLEANNISVEGRICLARYGGGHRGGKITVCQERGGVGTILFLEPSLPNTTNFYPNSTIVDGSALQRGALFTFADPETPGYPSVDGVYRDTNSSELPQIPALTVTYNFARKLLDQMEGEVLKLSGGARRTGPIKGGRKLRMVVNNKWARPIVYDIIGTIRGRLEPDRYSITGTHHDAWGFGAIDPSSSTANILELSRIMGQQLQRGWRPRRTVVLAIWAAEEIAIAGSCEWVEEKLLLLNRGAVGYTNVDNCASGIMFFAYASPVLRSFLVETTKHVPFNGTQTLHDYWYDYEHSISKTTKPQVYLTHGGMDNSAFNFLAGVPSAIFTFRPDKRVFKLGSYSSYHTAFETIRLFETWVDPTYHFMEACTRFNGMLTLTLAEAELLPYDFRTVAKEMQSGVSKLSKFREQLDAHGVPLDWLIEESSLYSKAAQKWHNWLEKAKLGEDDRRRVNDRMMLVERALLSQAPLEGRPTFRHLIFSPQLANAYAGTGFPVVHDLAYRARRLPVAEQEPIWARVRSYINRACIAVRTARNLLNPDMAIPTGTHLNNTHLNET
ncbi:N-acetylated-alpha-linked acidic dipeptidase 2-like [Dermacentor variabilis]|uniref:N-acetylated-alpha-linked acidic dipeptidase 2-like n=1 Tax=Dermacentor variabilis TaxID=34621 RepID=UPI003F5CA99F